VREHPGLRKIHFLTAWTVDFLLFEAQFSSMEEGSVSASPFFTEFTFPSFSRSLGSRKKGTGNAIFLGF